jgi:hypothetical protein
MSKEFSQRQKFIESCNQLVLRLDDKELNENIITDYAKKFYQQLLDNIKNVKELIQFYKKLLTNDVALKQYLTDLVNSIKKNIISINNEIFNGYLNEIDNVPTLKNLLKLSLLACATSFYNSGISEILKNNLINIFNKVMDSQLLNMTDITTNLGYEFFNYLVQIGGGIIFVYKVLIEPYKNQILKYIIGNINLNKQNAMTESKFTNHKKEKKKKVLITESQLRAMVRNELLNESKRRRF